MTAPMVTHRARTPLWMAPGVEYNAPTIARMRKGVAEPVPGQLWERVAEFGAQQDANGLIDASKRYAEAWHWSRARHGDRGRPVCVAIDGPRIGRHVCPVPRSHGILRPDVIR